MELGVGTCAVELESGVDVGDGVLEGGVELGGVLEICTGVEEGGGGVLEICTGVEEGGGGGGVEELDAGAGIELEAALGTLPSLPPSLYGGRRGKAAKENLLVLASQHAVPPDSSGRLESQQ